MAHNVVSLPIELLLNWIREQEIREQEIRVSKEEYMTHERVE